MIILGKGLYSVISSCSSSWSRHC